MNLTECILHKRREQLSALNTYNCFLVSIARSDGEFSSTSIDRQSILPVFDIYAICLSMAKIISEVGH